jgi:AAA domain
MRLFFIYGPPASGKLTIAQELSKRTGLPVFHNHQTRDIVHGIYPSTLMQHYDLVDDLRDTVFRYCAEHNTDIIFTFVYEGPEDDATVARKVATITQHGGSVAFIELGASHADLLNRVDNTSRFAHKKLTDRQELQRLLDNHPFSSVPYDNILKLDTSKLDPTATADRIIEHFEIQSIHED